MRTSLKITAGIAAAVVALGVAPPAVARPPVDEVQRGLDSLVRDDKFPGALAAVRDKDGRVRHYTAGRGVPRDGYVRIASNTKTFTAVVVLQLVGEGKVKLDEPVETYLPGMVRGEGIDGRQITVRQLLQHTSGLPDYDEIFVDYFPLQHRYFEPREMVDEALRKPALGAPGEKWSYSNTNYVLAGLIVQKVTGRPVGEEITKRVVDRIGLRETYWPAAGDQTIRRPHPRGYHLGRDVTVMDPSMGWAAGQMIATPSDLIVFFRALLDGRLLGPAEMAEMKKTVPADELNISGPGEYGLGLAKYELSCGATAWTHGGDAPGYATRPAVASNGRAATIAVTALPAELEPAKHVEEVLDDVLC